MTQVVEYKEILSLAEVLGESNILPSLGRAQKYSKHDIFVLAMIGHRLGIDPIASVMGIYIVEGRPFVSSRLVRGLILKNGHSFRVTEWTSAKITVLAARQGQEAVEFTYTLAEAQHAGLGSKNTWKSHPRRMLLAAVTRNVADALFADLFLGLTNDDGSDPGTTGDELDAEPAAVIPTLGRREKEVEGSNKNLALTLDTIGAAND